MARFYASIKGARGEATRLGTPASGMDVSVKSWSGEVNIHMYVRNDTDWVNVTLAPHNDARGASVCLYNGPCNGWSETYRNKDPIGQMVWDHAHGRKAA